MHYGPFPKISSREESLKLLRRILTRQRLRDHSVIALGGRLFTTQRFVDISKNAMHLRMLAAVNRRYKTMKNVIWLHEESSDGFCIRAQRCRGAVLGVRRGAAPDTADAHNTRHTTHTTHTAHDTQHT